ncbi:MAG: ABC transporter permease subunit [Candidatus Lokiarchaeota archaeon]|nr:ABC transporter permease subunit [Candidatus Lokiarchaeota archaeon]
MDRKHLLNIILTFVLGIVILYVGLVVTFFLMDSLPGDIALCFLPPVFTQPQYDAMVYQLGLNDPLFFRFLRYIGEFLGGSWGTTCVISAGTPVNEMLQMSVPRTIELLILPLSIAVNLGYLFGRVSNRTKHNWLRKGIQLLCALCIAVPIFVFGMFLQYNLSFIAGAFPAIGYKTPSFPNPPLVTGSRILDSMISGELYLAADTIQHYILPWLVLTVLFTALITRALSSNRVKDSYKRKNIISNTAKTSAIFGVILTFLILIDITFNLYGFGSRFLMALSTQDFFLIRGCMFVLLIWYVITIFASNLTFSLIGLIKDKKQQQRELKETIEREPDLSAKVEQRSYLNQIVRSPITIIGLVAVIIPIIVSIFPELISGYSFEEVFGIYPGAWSPPFLGTPLGTHPLGQASFGRDVLAQMAYGTRGSLILGLGAVLIGLIGGLIFGLLASKFKRVVHTLTMSFMLIFYILPGILLFTLFTGILGITYGLLMVTIGLLLIPGFTRIIANTEFRIFPIGKKIISYVPLFAGFAILLYVSLGFLGLTDPLTVNLGGLINQGRAHLYDAPWASLWPGLIAFLIVVSLFILHEGLAKNSR